MTIIAGFVCQGGILFATDTKHTFAGWMQMEAGKMFGEQYQSGGRTLFALSGNVHYAKMILQHCESRFRKLSAKRFTLENCRAVLERVLAEDYARHIHPHPEPRPSVEFLVGIYSPVSKKAGLFSTDETTVNRLYGYDCRGSGSYLGHFLLREKYKEINREVVAGRMLSDAQAKRVATHALEALGQIKAYDDSCGRATDLAWVGNDGRLSYITRFYEDHPDEETLDVLMTRLLTGVFPEQFRTV